MRILIADDDAIVAQSLATILGAEDDIEVVATASSGPQAVEVVRQMCPDVLLLDIQMPDGDGLSAAEQVLAADPQARIVFLTTFSDDDYIGRALRMGARGYLIKQDIARIAPALRGVMAGMSVLEGTVVERGMGASRVERAPGVGAGRGDGTGAVGLAGTGQAADGRSETPGEVGTAAAGRTGLRSGVFAALTGREFEVVEAVAEGLDNAEVAERLAMSEGTVRNHISAVLAKLGLRNRTQLAVFYYRSS